MELCGVRVQREGKNRIENAAVSGRLCREANHLAASGFCVGTGRGDCLSEASFSPSGAGFSKSPELHRWSCIPKQQPETAVFFYPSVFFLYAPVKPESFEVLIKFVKFS